MGLSKLLWSSLSRAGKLAAAATIAWGVLGVWVWSRYGARGPWYAEYGASQTILVVVGVTTLACFFTVSGLARPAHERSPAATWIPSLILGLSCLAGAVSWVVPRPRLARAEAAFEAEDWARAEAELDALAAREGALPGRGLALREQLDGVGARHDELERSRLAAEADDQRLSEVSERSLAYGATLVLRRVWTDPAKQALARGRLLERAEAIADEAWAGREANELARIAEDMRGIDDAFTARCESRAALAAAEACMDSRRWACVTEMLAKLEGRELETELAELRDAYAQAARRATTNQVSSH